ncbi:hypothetical protein J2741_001414 [Methanolinea mesophila]|uniref:hypothetical protein n=1 Tax=Methanolinea mesophila TaxID=547055 RepID=UPI001AE8A7F9|nr:hypothetical protein [Methanolinea mesophila]MBP1928867.1 hypothetical protein [Methanolinea mesophila]
MSTKRLFIILALAAVLFTGTVSAQYTLQDVMVTPSGENLVPLSQATTSATVAIIPSGPTTFIEGYTLVLSTGLDAAQWNVVVTVNGIQAAVIPKAGNIVYVNGYLLSYPTDRDVAVEVRVEGVVPDSPGGTTLTMLQVQELNNQGQLVGGSTQTVTRTIAGPPTSPPETITTVETVPHTVSPTPTKAGLSFIPAIAGIAAAIIILSKRNI